MNPLIAFASFEDQILWPVKNLDHGSNTLGIREGPYSKLTA